MDLSLILFLGVSVMDSLICLIAYDLMTAFNGFDFANKKVTVIGKGEAKASLLSMSVPR